MRKFIAQLLFLLFLSLNIFTQAYAQPQSVKEGVYDVTSLNLTSSAIHTIKNNSANEYAFMMIFDSNQIAQQLMQLPPNSNEYLLVPVQSGYQMLIVTNDAVILT